MFCFYTQRDYSEEFTCRYATFVTVSVDTLFDGDVGWYPDQAVLPKKTHGISGGSNISTTTVSRMKEALFDEKSIMSNPN